MKKDDERAQSRPERVPLHKQKLFHSEARPGFERRWVNDLPGRIEKFKLAGWTLVVGEVDATHDSLAQVESQLGSNVRRVVNKGTDAPARHAVLMEIPTEWYLQDKAEQLKLIDEQEEVFDRHGVHKSSGMYGSMKRHNATKDS